MLPKELLSFSSGECINSYWFAGDNTIEGIVLGTMLGIHVFFIKYLFISEAKNRKNGFEGGGEAITIRNEIIGVGISILWLTQVSN